MNELNDYELLMLCNEQNQEALEILYNKYKVIINGIVNNYKNILKTLEINKNDLYNECLNLFYEALMKYNDNYKNTFHSYIRLLVERKINKTITKKIIDDKRFNNYAHLIDLNTIDPLEALVKEENVLETNLKISKLTKEEIDVVELLLDNLNYTEVAKRLNKNYKQIYWIIEKLRRKFKILT